MRYGSLSYYCKKWSPRLGIADPHTNKRILLHEKPVLGEFLSADVVALRPRATVCFILRGQDLVDWMHLSHRRSCLMNIPQLQIYQSGYETSHHFISFRSSVIPPQSILESRFSLLEHHVYVWCQGLKIFIATQFSQPSSTNTLPATL